MECKHPTGLLQPIPILEWKWEFISTDFVTRLLRTFRQHDAIMMVLDKPRKINHFKTIKYTYTTIDISHIFMKEIFKLHRIPNNNILDRDAKFTLKFWKVFFFLSCFGTELAFNTSYHSQIDGENEGVNRVFYNMVRMYVMHQTKGGKSFFLC